MKILIIGENPHVPSGFGMQMNLLARGLNSRGHSIYVLSNNPPSFQEDRLEVWYTAEFSNSAGLDKQIDQIKPDVIIGFYHTQLIKSLAILNIAPRNCPILMWLPWEGSTLPGDGDSYFLGVPEDTVVHLSKFSQELWKNKAPSKHIIPHMYESDIFKFKDKKQVGDKFRKKWALKLKAPLLEDTVIILNLDRNIWHKRWDLTFDYIKRLQDKVDRPVHLIAHTVKHSQKHMYSQELEALAQLYGVYDQVTFTDFEWHRGFSVQDLAELYYMATFRISTSEGEGFGIPTVEAAACGCPQILNNHTTMPELVGKDYFGLVDASGSEEKLGSIWQIPNVTAMVDRTVNCLDDYDKTLAETKKVSRKARSRFNKERVIDEWDEIVNDVAAESDDCWYKSRWGYTSSLAVNSVLKQLPIVIKRLEKHPSILEIGSFDGTFIQSCVEHGLVCQGLEFDFKAHSKIPKHLHKYIKKTSLIEHWPVADVIVLTDVIDLLYMEYGVDRLQEIIRRLYDYSWVIIKRGISHRWGCLSVNPEDVNTSLDHRMTRRSDLETIIKEHFCKDLVHEIWQRGKDEDLTLNIPEALIK